MTTPSKPNDVTTPLSVVPGVPHWRQTDHNQVDIGQGYDFHDPVSLQIGGESAYKTGTAISMFGKVGFRSDQSVINTDHGRIYELEITRKYGTQGTFDFFITWAMAESTGVLGSHRTAVEHGFNVCKVDVDLTTLNPQVSAEAAGWRIRMEDGRSRMMLRVIAPYRTKIRTADPVVLQKPYTYLIKERSDVWAGFDESTLPGYATHPHYGGGGGFSPTPGWPRTNGWNAVTSITMLQDARDYAFYNKFTNGLFRSPYENLRPEAAQHNTLYKVLTLPVPTSFIEPNVGIPEWEYWKTQFNIYSHENLTYTIGTKMDVIVYTRIYICRPGGQTSGGKWSDVARGHFYTFHPDENDTKYDIIESNATTTGEVFMAGSDSTWSDLYHHVYNPTNNSKTSGYVSRKGYAFTATSADYWDRDYTGYINEAQGDIIFLENEIEHKVIPSGYNAMFNYVGTAVDSSILDGVVKFCPNKTTLPITILDARNDTPLNPWPYMPWPVGSSGHTVDRIFSRSPYRGGNWGNSWTVHDPLCADIPGMGEDGTSSVLYDLTSLSHPASSYEKNDILKGYYKSCIDHIDKHVVLDIVKANEYDPVQLDKTTRSTSYINKSTTYDVPLHAVYDDTVELDHQMDPGPVFAAFQAWDESPTDPSLTQQLFVPLGADVNNQVQFISLSAGALTGGSTPRNKLKRPVPKVGPKLKVIPGLTTSDNVAINSTTPHDIMFKNTGGEEMIITFYNQHPSIQSIDGTPYDTTATPPSGDKLDDWSWEIKQPYRTNSFNQSNTVALSADEMVTVTYELTARTGNPDGYGVFHDLEVDLGALYGGIASHEVKFNISVF